ncbi:MAG: polysaccharide biosynthesis/export family protein [Hasllibacter sp.]
MAAALALAVLALTSLVQPAPAQIYTVQPGDVLRIEVLEDSELNREVLVTPDGAFSFPFAGTLPARGRTLDQLADDIARRLSPNFASEPNVFVSVRRLAERELVLPEAPLPPAEPVTIPVYVSGEIASPGRFEVAPGTTILQAIAQAGGPTRFAAETRIQLRRTEAHTGRVLTYAYNYLGTGGGISGATVLAPGDVIIVPERRLFELR